MTGIPRLRSDSISSRDTNRRQFIIGITSGITGLFAGCSSFGESATEANEAGNPSESSSTEELPEEYYQAKSKLNRAFSQLDSLPIVEGEELVFDVTKFAESFDHREVMDLGEEAFEIITSIEEGDLSDGTVERLAAASRLAHSLAELRLILNDVIVYGVRFGTAFQHEEYQDALTHIDHALTALGFVDQNGSRIDEQLSILDGESLDIPRYDHKRIITDRRFAEQVFSWTQYSYEGFYHTASGGMLMLSGSAHLERERIEEAIEQYGRAGDHFANAVDAFDTAHGQGRHLPQVAGLFESLRCQVPKLRDGAMGLEEAIEEYDHGDEEGAKETANEAFLHLEQVSRRCR